MSEPRSADSLLIDLINATEVRDSSQAEIDAIAPRVIDLFKDGETRFVRFGPSWREKIVRFDRSGDTLAVKVEPLPSVYDLSYPDEAKPDPVPAEASSALDAALAPGVAVTTYSDATDLIGAANGLAGIDDSH